MKFDLPKGKNEQSRPQNLCLTTIYFPHSGYKENNLELFNSDISSFLSTLLRQKNTVHIIGADTNSSIGTSRSLPKNETYQDKTEDPSEVDPIINLLGPNGNQHRSKTGEEILNMMREFELRAASTYFDNNRKYNTWLGLPNANTKKRKAYQIDHIFIPKLQLCQTTSVRRRFDGATSDHAAVSIDFHFLTAPLLKKKRDMGKKTAQKET